MLNRRFLRIKALQDIYAYQQSESDDLMKAERALLQDVDRLYELFIMQLSFWVEVKLFAERRIEENKNKHFPTEEDLNPNLKFVNNRILNILQNNTDLQKFEEKYKINWADYREDFIRGFYNRLLETEEYKSYMNNGEDSFDDDKRFLVAIVDGYMADDTILYDFYSDRSLMFNSDYDVAIYLLWKFLSEMPSAFNENSKLPTAYKTENDEENDDKDFLVKLFRNTILHADEFGETIKANISNWDYDRVALMDRIIMQMAMTEFCYFPTIPVKVTINEYIEVSKLYSTPESRRFVNGMLDKISNLLREEGKMKKYGAGLGLK